MSVAEAKRRARVGNGMRSVAAELGSSSNASVGIIFHWWTMREMFL